MQAARRCSLAKGVLYRVKLIRGRKGGARRTPSIIGRLTFRFVFGERECKPPWRRRRQFSALSLSRPYRQVRDGRLELRGLEEGQSGLLDVGGGNRGGRGRSRSGQRAPRIRGGGRRRRRCRRRDDACVPPTEHRGRTGDSGRDDEGPASHDCCFFLFCLFCVAPGKRGARPKERELCRESWIGKREQNTKALQKFTREVERKPLGERDFSRGFFFHLLLFCSCSDDRACSDAARAAPHLEMSSCS